MNSSSQDRNITLLSFAPFAFFLSFIIFVAGYSFWHSQGIEKFHTLIEQFHKEIAQDIENRNPAFDGSVVWDRIESRLDQFQKLGLGSPDITLKFEKLRAVSMTKGVLDTPAASELSDALHEKLFEKEANLSQVLVSIAPLGIAVVLLFLWLEKRSTSRKHEENNADQAKIAEYRAIFDSILDIVIVTDRFGVVESVNPAIEKALGYSPDELLGKNVKTIMGDLNSRVHDDYVERYLKTGKKAIIGIGREVQAQHKNGNLIPIELGLTEVKSGDNHKFVGIMRDVTERKAFERELVFAKNAAQRGENAKTEFLTIMGHELRTPMNGIIGMLSLLKESKLQTVETDYVNHAYTAATNLMTILNDILDYIKTDSKNFELDEIEFDLRRLVEEIIDHYSVSAMNKSVELRHMVSGKVPTRLLGDPARLRQVLTQLVDNGIKYTEKGEVVIFVDVSSVNNRRVDIKIDVTDTGIGIDEKEMGGMFQLFSQGNSGIDRSRGGIGIGLAICKKFTALMHGKITVKSKLGEGSTFSLDLPFRMSDVIDSTSTEEVSTKGHRALVVSKEDQSVVHLRGQLAAMQMTSVGVGSLTQVVDGLKLGVEESRKFSVIVIDLDIEEYVSWVQSSTIVAAAVDDVPVILLSTSGQRGDAQKARDNGAWGYLSKPYDRAELSTCIKLVLQQKKDSTKRNLITRYSIAESRQSDAISILLAENDRKKRTEVTRFLQSQGYKVDVVEDGAELMEAVEKQVYNVIVVDTHLPVINGFESTIQIRALEKSNKLSRSLVIAVAPSDQSYIRSRCIGVGVDECLVRPIDIEQLNKVLDKHLKNDAPDTQSDGQAV